MRTGRMNALQRWRRRRKLERIDSRLVFADALCPCGYALAYDPTGPSGNPGNPASGYWDCSGILTGIADPKVQHTDMLPFVFYKLKPKAQKANSANGGSDV